MRMSFHPTPRIVFLYLDKENNKQELTIDQPMTVRDGDAFWIEDDKYWIKQLIGHKIKKEYYDEEKTTARMVLTTYVELTTSGELKRKWEKERENGSKKKSKNKAKKENKKN